MLPYRYTAAGIRRVNAEEDKPVCVYFHPWEIDPKQPALASGVVSWLRTYTGIRGMYAKLDRMLYDFSFGSITEVYGGLLQLPEQQHQTCSISASSGR
jgi:hypothetical protein